MRTIIRIREKDDDEDSKLSAKGKASRGRCKPGASSRQPNITSELQTETQQEISCLRVGSDGFRSVTAGTYKTQTWEYAVTGG